MAITRSQIARQLMQEGGVPRQGYFLGKLVKKIKDDIIPNELKTDLGKAATAAALGYGFNKYGIPGTSGIGTTGENIGKGSISNIFKGVGNIFTGGRTPAGTTGGPIDKETGDIFVNPNDEFGIDGDVYGTSGSKYGNRQDDDRGFLAKTADFLKKKRLGTDKSIAGLLMKPQALAIGSGLLAGAFTKDKDDPAFTGQDVGLNLRDIRRLANVTDPKAGQAIGLSFLPDVEARKFTPTEMAASFATGEPVDFTEQRQQAQEGGIMGDQKDFEEFLQDMQDRDKSMLQDRILQDFEKFMKRKRMLENLPEAKNGGIMKASYGYDEAMSDTYDSYLDMKKKGLIPPTMSFDEFLQEVVPEMSKRQDTSGMMASDILGDESDDLAIQLFGKPVKELNPAEMQELQMEIDRLQNKFRAAKGGIASMAEGGMMDMGGMEMDLRGGGFVPMGAKEKADDVPARLSKNEFVFTADAVRAAGGGDVDKGADKMYATMKKLEDRVA